MSEIVRPLLLTAWAAYLLILAIWIVLKKRSPAATIGWLLGLAFLPYAGLVIFQIFGPQDLTRKRLRRLSSRTAVAREHRHFHTRFARPDPRVRQLATMVGTISDMPLTTAIDLTLLVDGGNTYEAIFQAIGRARHHVHLEYYIYEPDHIGTALRDLLTAKAREGVKVRLLLDALGAKRVTRRWMRAFLKAGGELAFFHPVGLRRLRPVINMRTHRKIVVCDGRIGFVGGLNITDAEDERRRPDAYRDLHLRMEGNAVHGLQRIFLEDWHYSTGQLPTGPELAPDLPGGIHPVQVIPSGPDTPLTPILRAQISAINEATSRVWLTTPYFVPDEPAIFALTSAALRGVDVRVLTPRRSDSLVVSLAARSYFDELIEAGGQVWEYRSRMLHSKTLVVDDQYGFIGTANFDNRSFRLNFEVMVLAYGPNLSTRLAQHFETDLLESDRVEPNRKRSPPEMLGEAAARLISPVL